MAQDSVRAVDRALEILLAFTPADDELAVSEILKRVDLSRPTLYRLLGTLERNRFLMRSGEPQRYRLGPAVAQLAHVWSASHNLGVVAQPMMHRAWKETGETVALFVPDGPYRLCVAEMPSAQPLSFKRGVGYRERLVLGASGRAILAYTGGTPPKELAQDRARGYAISREELIKGAVAIAAPFFNGSGQVAGSIGVFGPSVRLDDAKVRKFGKLLVREAGKLSKALGRAAGA
jgi:DNA-binding IclR family transcriptional regulator